MAGRPIDEKIVVMKLDNSDFKNKAAETTGIFGKITSALNKIPGVNLGKTTGELKNIGSAAKGVDMAGLASNVDKVASRFSAMGVIATTALATVTSMATQAGLGLAKSLTMDQVTDGFREYETKIGAIGTMLANTEWAGSDLNDVKKTLGELNDYADQTIYNFGEMTSSIGRFTAAGVTLEDSAIAIKGLGNLAAVSGSSSEQLNTAMYQSSQALASGKLNLEDWNSLVNAGMAGKKTQDALVKTAKEMGKNVDLAGGFRNSIQDGWLTSEVFLKTLKKFGEDESMTKAATSVRTFSGAMDSLKEGIGSGWATTFEHLFGDFEEATVFWTNLSSSIGGFFSKQADERNKMMEGIANGGGFQNMFQGIANAAKPVGQIFSAIGEGFSRAFPPKSVDQIVKMTQSFKEFTAGLKLNVVTTTKLTTIFHGFFSIFSTAIEIVKRLAAAFVQMIPPGIGSGILDILEKVAKMALGFNQSVKDGNALTGVIDGLGVVFKTFGQVLVGAFGAIGKFGGMIMSSLGPAFSWLGQQLGKIGNWFRDAFGNINGSDVLGAGMVAAIASIVAKIWGMFSGGMFEDLIENVTDTFSGLKDSINSFATGIKFVNLILIATAVGILAASLKTLEGIKTEDLSKGLKTLAISLGIMMGAMLIIGRFNIAGGIGAATTMIALAAAVNVMASALKKISDLNPDELTRGINGLVGVTATLSVAIIAISKLGGKMKVSSLQLLALSTSIVILASAVETMSEIDGAGLAKSITALGIIFAELAIFLKVVGKTKLGPGSAIGLIGMAAALHLMVGAIKQIDGIDTNSLIKGLTTIGILLAEVAIFSRVAGGPNMMLAGVGLVALSIAINALMIPIKTLAGMSLTELAKGLGGLAAALAIVSIAAGALTTSLIGAAGLTVMAGALIMLMVPIKMFAAMSWEELIKGFVGLAGGLTIVGVASLLLAPATIPMLAFGAALLVMGAAILAVGAGIALFGIGLTTLATLTSASVAAIVAALGLLIQGMVSLIPGLVNFLTQLGVAILNGIATLGPLLMQTIATLIMSLLQTITDNLPKFIDLGVKIVIQLAEGIGQNAGPLVDAGLQLIINLIQALSQAIRDNGPVLISTILELLGEIMLLFINAGAQVINALLGWIPGVNSATAWVVENAESVIRDNFGAKEIGESKGIDFAGGLGSKAGDAKNAGTNVAESGKGGAAGVNFNPTGVNLGQAFAGGLAGTSGNANSSGNLIAQFGLQGAAGVNYNPTGTGAGNQFAQGLGGTSGSANSSGVSIANSGAQGASSVSLNSHGNNFGLGFANGMESSRGSILEKAKSLAQSAASAVAGWLDMHSPSRLLFSYGEFFGEGFALGVEDKTKRVGDVSKSMAKTAEQSVNEFLDGFDPTPDNNEIKFKATVDYTDLDPTKVGRFAQMRLQPNLDLTNSLASVTKAQMRQNVDNNRSKVYDDSSTRMLLAEINDNINRIDPNKPVLLMLKDKLIGESVTKEVMDNYDFKYMKAERGLADA